MQKVTDQLESLLRDEKKLCYLFPDSLLENYIKVIKNTVDKSFYETLDWDHEALYLGKKKQLLVYKLRSSLEVYLSKYRLPTQYKGCFANVLNASKESHKLIIERNLAISEDK